MKTTINYKGFDLDIEYEYQAEERQTYDYPGCSESACIENVYLNDVDIFDLVEDQLDDIEKALFKHFDEYRN